MVALRLQKRGGGGVEGELRRWLRQPRAAVGKEMMTAVVRKLGSKLCRSEERWWQ
ncbi:neurofascin isoform X7 [Sesbania bispinosa]|nr:neurofascin isoform X7 [Sesbania bispinosa]